MLKIVSSLFLAPKDNGDLSHLFFIVDLPLPTPHPSPPPLFLSMLLQTLSTNKGRDQSRCPSVYLIDNEL